MKNIKVQAMPKQLMQKATMMHANIYASKIGQPQWSEGNYSSLAAEGHNGNVWAFACINAIATSSADIPLVLYQRKGKEKVEIDEHPLLDLLKKPNNLQSGREFREEFAKYLLISGRAFIEKNGPSDTRVTELWNHRPDSIAAVPDKQERIGGYTQQTEAGEFQIPREKLIFWRSFNPLNELDGKSPLQVAGKVVDMDNSSNAWNKSLLDNGGAPPGVFVSDTELQDTTFRRMRAQINRMFGGKKNAGKPVLLEKGVKYQRTGLSPLDMGFKDQKDINTLEICAAFNVPPEIVGYSKSKTYNNYAEARTSFYEETVLPFTKFFLEKLNNDLVPLFGKGLELGVDADKVDALQENTDAVWERTLKAVDKGVLSPDEAREVFGYSTRGKEADKLRVNKPVAVPAASDDPSKGQSSGASQKTHTGENNDPFDLGMGMILSAVKQLQQKDQSDADYFDLFNAEREPFVLTAEKLIQKRFKEEADAVVKAVAKDGMKGMEKALKAQEKEWKPLLKVIYSETIEHFGNWNYDRLKEEYDASKGAGAFERKFFNRLFTMARRLIQTFIGETAVEAVTNISKTTRETLRMVISDGVDAGHDLAKISRSIRKVYGNDFGPRRSMVIARTEVLAASNFGAREGALATGLELEKTWVTTLDGRERDTHKACNKQTRDMNDPYDVGGSKGMYPGDPDLPPQERIQCRCCEKHKVKE